MRSPNRSIPPLSPRDIARFWAKVRIRGPNDCWPWTAAHLPRGYGLFHMWDGVVRAMLYAHRVAWTLAHGPIPPGLCVCHTCDVPGCTNPRHLFLGTQADNVRDRDRKGRHVSLRGERRGNAKLTDAKVRAIRTAYARGGVTHRALARRHHISHQIIGRILTRKRWAHVAPGGEANG